MLRALPASKCVMANVATLSCFSTLILTLTLGLVPSSVGVTVFTMEKDVWANEFEFAELTCVVETDTIENPRVEWKKIKNGITSHVYYQEKVQGDFENRAELRGPAHFQIFNTSRSDTAVYRCEVAARDDRKSYAEIEISLTVRVKPLAPTCSVPEAVLVGMSTELRCLETQGFPAPQYRWFYNKQELPLDPKSSPEFRNSSYSINPDTGWLEFQQVRKEDSGEYYCQAWNAAGHAQCDPQTMGVYDVDILGICLKASGGLLLFFGLAACIYHCRKREWCRNRGHGETSSQPGPDDGVECEDTDEGAFRHKPSFVV